MVRTFTGIIAHNARLMRASTTGLAFRQPENLVDFSSASRDGLRFTLSVLDVIGSADQWKLTAAWQLCKWGMTGAPNTSWAWYDVPEHKKPFMLPEGDWQVEDDMIVNLSPNPSLLTDATGWAQLNGTGGSASGSHQAGTGFHGAGFRRATWTAATTSPSGGQSGPTAPVTAGLVHTFGLAARPSKQIRGRWSVEWSNGARSNSPEQVVPGGVWTYGGVRAVPPVGVTTGRCWFESAGTEGVSPGAANWASGNTLDVDAHLVAAGSRPIQYVHGSQGAPAELGVVARHTDPLPVLTSSMIRGFGRFAAVRFGFQTLNPSSDFGLRISLNAE